MELKPCPFCGGESEGVSDKGVVYGRIIHKRDCPLYEMIGAMPQRQWEAWNHRPTEDALRAERDALRKDARFLLSFVPSWAEVVPRNMEPMYATGSYEGDLEVKARVDRIKKALEGGEP